MKKIIEDIKREGFARREYVVYGIVMPAAIFIAALVGGLLENI